MSSAKLDLDAESRQALEFDAVLSLVADHAATAPGRRRVLALDPVADPEWITAEQARVDQAVRLLAVEGRFVPAGLPDPTPILDNLEVEGWHPGPVELRDLAVVLVAAADLGRLGKLDPGSYPSLVEDGRRIPDLGDEAREILRYITPEGQIDESASPELQKIRAATTRLSERLRRILERMVRDPGADRTIRDDFVTQRNGRFVIPVRVDAPVPTRGIVHASSSSGATLFVEPMETVELNNELIRLADREREEQDRLLTVWSGAFRVRLDEVREALDALAALDSVQARAGFARVAEAVRPETGTSLDLREVRHPLLDHRLREHGERCVPQDLRTDDNSLVLVLSGPNTGGKTVALKTLGLAVVMAQAGLPVVAKSASIPLFRQVRADIGDHQSIDADLSTFSAHVSAASRFLEEAKPPALFLFDEIGTGTEPGEGAALAQALLEDLLARKVSVVVTTHQAALKAWAFSTAGASSAAMDFDLETLKPTYRVIHDAAGMSAGLDIASRLGLPRGVVDKAREILGPGARETEDLLTRLRDSVVAAEARVQELARRGDDLDAERDRLRAEVEREARRRRKDLDSALDEALREFRELARREVAAIKDRREKARASKAQERAEMRLAGRARKTRDAIEPGRDSAPGGPAVIETGARVRVRSLARDGEIVNVMGNRVQVRLGSTTFTVGTEDLEAPSEPSRSAAPKVSVTRPMDDTGETVTHELKLLGMTVDDALVEVDRFLDRATLSGLSEVRIVHGHGTGRLRSAVRLHLGGHPQVDSHRPGRSGEGGDGATVVRIK